MSHRYWQQQRIQLPPKTQGFHLISDDIERQLTRLAEFEVGLLHLQLLHTSASLSLNENADADVRRDLHWFLQQQIGQFADGFLHTCEGPDDMPAHVCASLLGTSLTIAIEDGRLALGTWQGIYLGEHRLQAGSRQIIATLHGEPR